MGGSTWGKIKINLKENLFALSFYDDKIGYAVGAKGTILKTEDGGKTWKDVEPPQQTNLYDILAYSRNGAIAVGALGLVLSTENGGETWEVQPNITTNALQAIEFRGGISLWVAGRGGTILKRSQRLSTLQFSRPSIPPLLRPGSTKTRLRPRNPVLRIADDGDIPRATKPKKQNN